jgi:aldehyde dehydrogenase (NAD+)
VSQLLQQAHDDRYGLYINGRYIDSLAQKYIPSLDPTSDDPWYEISDASAGDVDAAVSAARAALANPAWSRLSQTGRGKLLRRLGDLISGHAERLAEIETRDNGKLIREM